MDVPGDPTEAPTKFPINLPSFSPTKTPTSQPTFAPTKSPTELPTVSYPEVAAKSSIRSPTLLPAHFQFSSPVATNQKEEPLPFEAPLLLLCALTTLLPAVIIIRRYKTREYQRHSCRDSW